MAINNQSFELGTQLSYNTASGTGLPILLGALSRPAQIAVFINNSNVAVTFSHSASTPGLTVLPTQMVTLNLGTARTNANSTGFFPAGKPFYASSAAGTGFCYIAFIQQQDFI